MKYVFKPKLFNNDDTLEIANQILKQQNEKKLKFKRIEFILQLIWFVTLLGLIIVFLKDFPFINLFKKILSFKNPELIINHFIDFINSSITIILNSKLYYFTLILIITLVYKNPYFLHSFIFESYKKAYKKALKLIAKNDYKSAITKLNSILEFELPDLELVKVKLLLCECYFNTYQYNECLKEGFDILNIEADNHNAKIFIGKSFLALNQTDEISVPFLIYIFKNNYIENKLIYSLASYLLNNNDTSEIAIEIYEKAYELFPERIDIREMLFKTYVNSLNCSRNALKLYEEIHKENPNRNDVKLILAIAYFKNQNFKSAINIVELLFNEKIFSKDILEVFTKSYQKLGYENKIYDKFIELINKNPENIILKSYFEQFKNLFLANKISTSINNNNVNEAKINSNIVNVKNKINICRNCAHINPPLISYCEKCKSAL